MKFSERLYWWIHRACENVAPWAVTVAILSGFVFAVAYFHETGWDIFGQEVFDRGLVMHISAYVLLLSGTISLCCHCFTEGASCGFDPSATTEKIENAIGIEKENFYYCGFLAAACIALSIFFAPLLFISLSIWMTTAAVRCWLNWREAVEFMRRRPPGAEAFAQELQSAVRVLDELEDPNQRLDSGYDGG